MGGRGGDTLQSRPTPLDRKPANRTITIVGVLPKEQGSQAHIRVLSPGDLYQEDESPECLVFDNQHGLCSGELGSYRKTEMQLVKGTHKTSHALSSNTDTQTHRYRKQTGGCPMGSSQGMSPSPIKVMEVKNELPVTKLMSWGFNAQHREQGK